MIDKVVVAMNAYLADWFSKYGIESRWKESRQLDVENEYRNAYGPIVSKGTGEEGTDPDGYDSSARPGSSNLLLGLFSREPLRKSQLLGNANGLEVLSDQFNAKHERVGVQIQSAMFAEIRLRYRLAADSTLLADTVEMLFVNHLDGHNMGLPVTIRLSKETDPIEDIQYNVQISTVNSAELIRSTDLRTIDFDVQIDGPLFSPFYKNRPVYSGEMELWVFNKSVELTPDNNDKGTLVITMHPPVDATHVGE